eukprot:gene10700-16463_t
MNNGIQSSSKQNSAVLRDDLLCLSGLTGFKHFSLLVIGREEVLVTVKCSSDQVPNGSFSVVQEGHAPNTPSKDRPGERPNELTFLFAVYKMYDRPMVWCRSRREGHLFDFKEVVGWSGEGEFFKRAKSNHDFPLALPSCLRWQAEPDSVSIHTIISDIVASTLPSPPQNPLAVDFSIPIYALPTPAQSPTPEFLLEQLMV